MLNINNLDSNPQPLISYPDALPSTPPQIYLHIKIFTYISFLHFKANYPSENGKLSIAITFELIPNPNSKSS